MAHRTIERIIGRLLTDEDLRLKFKRSIHPVTKD